MQEIYFELKFIIEILYYVLQNKRTADAFYRIYWEYNKVSWNTYFLHESPK